MKRFLWSALCLAALASGCITVEETIVLEDKGSGSLRLKYSIPEQTVSQLQGMLTLKQQLADAAAKPEAGEADPLTRLFVSSSADQLRQELKSYEKHGVKVHEVQFDNRHGRRNVLVVLDFEDVFRLNEIPVFPLHQIELATTPDGNYAMTLRSTLEDRDELPDMTDENNVRLVQPLLAGFKVDLSIMPPGPVLRTDGVRQSSRAASWTFDFDRDAEAVANLQAANMTVIFGGEGITLPVTSPAAP
jgi:hypothetical protein